MGRNEEHFYGVVVGNDVDPQKIVHSRYVQVGGGG